MYGVNNSASPKVDRIEVRDGKTFVVTLLRPGIRSYSSTPSSSRAPASDIASLKKSRSSNEQVKSTRYEEYLKSDHWKQIRSIKLKEHGSFCERCGANETDLNSGKTVILDIHHQTYARLGRELMSDLEVLCRECHARHHKKLDHQSKKPKTVKKKKLTISAPRIPSDSPVLRPSKKKKDKQTVNWNQIRRKRVETYGGGYDPSNPFKRSTK